jgi:acetyl esterase/lipase
MQVRPGRYIPAREKSLPIGEPQDLGDDQAEPYGLPSSFRRCAVRKAFMAVGLFVAGTTLGWLGAFAQDRPAAGKPFVHIPDTVSPEARKYLESLPDPATRPPSPAADDFAGWKREWEAGEAAQQPHVEAALKRFEPTIEERKVGGVPVVDVKPKGWKDNGQVLVHAHGGAYTMYSARSRLPSSVLAADATGLRIISIDYTVAPAGRWEKVTDEVLAVFAGLQKEGFKWKDLAIYGESAGGALAAGAVLKMRDQGLGMPAAVVLWSPWADITNRGDSAVTLKNAEPTYLYEKHLQSSADAYADPKDQRHPYVSPVYADYTRGFPPTLIQGGTKEIFLSHAVRLHRAIDGAGGVAVLDLYDGMPHIFQLRPGMASSPESRAAMKKMKAFLQQHLAN